MGLVRLFVIGILAAAALYIVASAVVILVPYVVAGMALLFTTVGVHSWLSKKDAANEITPD